jgi:hypothetical protein
MNMQRLKALPNTYPRSLRRGAVLAGSAAALGLLLCFADLLLAGPVRTWAERMMNSKLNGYTVHIGRARPHLWRLGLGLDQLILVQQAYPDPPVADVGALEFSLTWWELVRFKVAGDLTIRQPALHINLTQIQHESNSHVSLKDRGWQDAVEAIFPFKLNQVKITDGSLVYLSGATESKPLQLTKLFMLARNVRNIDATVGDYPSPVTLEGRLFDTGTLAFQGQADFLRKPTLAAHGTIHLARVPLDRFGPLAKDYQLATQGGFLTATGTLESTPAAQKAHLSEVLLEDLRVDYLTSPATQGLEHQHAKEAVTLAKSVRNAPTLVLQVDRLRLTHSRIGFDNKGTKPPYRVFIANVDMDLTNLSNQAKLGRSEFNARGAFMGHGTARLTGSGRMTAVPADFQAHLQVEAAQLPDLNDLFQAYSGLTVAAGQYALYSEFTVKDGKVDGYIKPLLTQVKVFDRKVDKDKPLVKRIEMHVVQGLANLFENHASKEVATVTRVSGPTRSPKASELQTLGKLLGNGFFRAILPGFLNKPEVKPAAAGSYNASPRNPR